MKKTYFLTLSLLAVIFSFSACDNFPEPDYWASKNPFQEEVTLYYEDFGPTATGNPSVTAYNGYKKEGLGAEKVTYTSEGGTVSIRTTSASSGYPGASGGCNAMAATATGATLIINDIATCGAKKLVLSFGTNQNSDTMSVAYKINGTDNWIPLPFTKASTTWGLVENIEINIVSGNTIKLKFTALNTGYGARIDDIKITTTDQTGDPIVDPDGGTVNPGDTLTVAQAVANQNEEIKWVKGYIVGCVKNGVSSVSTAADVFLGVSSGWDSQTNVLIADSPEETDYHKCVAVNLPAGQPLRTEVNLVTNPENHKKTLAVKGKLRTYFGIAGLRDMVGSSADFILGGQGGTVNPNDPDPVTSLSENFESFAAGADMYFSKQADSKGWKGFKIQGTLEPDVRESSGNKYAYFSAHRNSITTQTAQEFWLVSPRLNVSAASSKTLSFETVGGYFNAATVFEIYVLNGDDPVTATKTKLEGWRLAKQSDIVTGSYTPFIPSGNIDLSGFSGIIRIGFYYKGTSGSGNSTTYQMDNFVFNGGDVTVLNVSPSSLSFVKGGEAKTFTVTSSKNWTAVSSDPTNFAVSVSGNTVTVTATANTAETSRTATVTVSTTDGQATKTVTLTQAGQGGSTGGAIFVETFGNAGENSGTVAPSNYTDWDNAPSVTYSGNVVIRKTNNLDTHAWFAATTSANPTRTLTMSGINTAGASDMKLSFDIATNATTSITVNNLMIVSVKDLNTGTETTLTIPATALSATTNTYVKVSDITGIPATSKLEITFKTDEVNTMGLRLDNVRIDGTK